MKNFINLYFEDMFIIYHQYSCVTHTVDPNPSTTKKCYCSVHTIVSNCQNEK